MTSDQTASPESTSPANDVRAFRRVPGSKRVRLGATVAAVLIVGVVATAIATHYAGPWLHHVLGHGPHTHGPLDRLLHRGAGANLPGGLPSQS